MSIMSTSRRYRTLWLIVVMAAVMVGVQAMELPWDTLQWASVILAAIGGAVAVAGLVTEGRKRRRGDPVSRLDE